MHQDPTTSRDGAPGRRGTRRFTTKVLLGTTAAFAMVAVPTGAAFAATGTSSATLSTGSLSIGTVTPEAITGTVAAITNGILPSAPWSDTTGTGNGWNGTVAVSDLTYTGAWVAQGGATALTTATSGTYTDTQDGVVYTVTTGIFTSGIGSFTWTSTDSTDHLGGSVTVATASLPSAVGTKGITINFGTQTLVSGLVYRIEAGTESPSAFSLLSGATGAGITAASGTTSTAPAFVLSGTTVTGGGVGSTAYGSTAIKFVSAAINTGMGTYTVNPGVQVVTDANSWAATYTAGVQYSIVSGP